MVQIQKINNHKVKPVPIDDLDPDNDKPVKGADILPEIYSNVFILAKKKSGKSTLIYDIVKECADPRTMIYAFVSTLNKDKTYRKLKKYCQSKKIEFNGFLSIMEDKINILQNIIDRLAAEHPIESDEEEEEEEPKQKEITYFDESEEEEEPKKKYKYKVPEYIFILDDLSTELNNPAIIALLKKNRHFNSKVLIGNQYWNDLNKGGRKMTDYMIIFGSQPYDKLEEIHKELDLSTTIPEFIQLYETATNEKYNFLYIDVVNEIYRKNFDSKLTL